jgi:hypothetical protein
LFTTTTVSGSACCTAVHSAWIEYIIEPSPMIAAMRRPGCASEMPTEAGSE